MSLTLKPLSANDLPRVALLRVAPDQIRFSGTVLEAFAAAEPDVDFHGIFKNETAVGFFKIDQKYHEKYPFAQDGDLGLRAFLIDLHQQGKGMGTQTCRALPGYLPPHYPNARTLWLTVNLINLGAIKSYQKGGFTKTEETWPHGEAGPQHIMRLPLKSKYPNPSFS